jgi:hypothetical protein
MKLRRLAAKAVVAELRWVMGGRCGRMLMADG